MVESNLGQRLQFPIKGEVQALIDERHMSMRQLQCADHWQWSSRGFIRVNTLPVGVSGAVTLEVQCAVSMLRRLSPDWLLSRGANVTVSFAISAVIPGSVQGGLPSGDLFRLDTRASGQQTQM